ncbi:MAG: HEPN domain-containing protein [Methanobacterium sp.]|nr:HEPN domain-containing protein [Methanobacterium sp.]
MDEAGILMKNAYEKLEAARTLFKNEFYGDAVSRAYYAMFFAAKALLAEKDIYPRTHRGLISQFGLELVKKGEFKKELFDLLTRAQEDREEADYGLFPKLDEEEAKIIIDGAELFLEECKSILL